ncbi:MAG: glycerol-3-phosphate 1-O-acyltransferase PlsY [Sandaracinaceae bacterium]
MYSDGVPVSAADSPGSPWIAAALVVAGYLVGSISFGLLVADRRGIDLRNAGSGNTGATNVARVVGKREGRLVLGLDAAKGALPTLIALGVGLGMPWAAAVAVASVTGHCWPLWHGLRGGKGAATAAGAILVLSWPAGLAAIATYLVARRLTRKVSVGSLAGAVVGAAGAWLVDGLAPTAVGATTIAVLVWVRHADNLGRLWRGEEPDT